MQNENAGKTKMIAKKFFFLAAAFIATSCGTVRKADQPYRAQVIHFLPSSVVSAGRWNVSEQLLSTLEDPDLLRGKYFEILSGRKLTIDSTVGSIVSGKISGITPRNPIRYSMDKGVMVPRDTTTLLMFSSFHAFEQVFEKLEAAVGITPDAFKQNLGNRVQIFFEPTIDAQDNASETRVSIKTNAAFNADADNFILFRRSFLEDIPLAANTKVLAHEFGHALFKTSFYNRKNDKCVRLDDEKTAERAKNKFFAGRLETEYAISGFNEGYSDFNSYIMTGDTNPLEGSLSVGNINSRALNGKPFYFYQLSSEALCDGRFYCIGTLFARALYKVASKFQTQSDEQFAFSRRIFSALGTTLNFMKEEPSAGIYPEPSDDVTKCARRDSFSLTYDSKVTSAFLAAFLKGLPSGDEKLELCDAFAELFGTAGFTKEARTVCES
jgi:hypothetical protein